MALAAQQNDYFNLVNNKPEPKDYHLEKQHTHQVISLISASNERPRSISQTQSNSVSSIHTLPEEPTLSTTAEEIMTPKRHSTSFNLASASSFKATQKKNRNTLARNYTTGTAEQDVSEEFQKELTARRKTFKRLSKRRPDDQEDRVLMGTLISEGHQNYILMYNMLTGIRIAVGRVSAKPDRPIVDQDFSAAHKLAFDV